MSNKKVSIATATLVFFISFSTFSKPEMIIGEAEIEPGIKLIFEGGIKDEITPTNVYLNEIETDVHLEILANWSNEAPKGAPKGGHVAYLEVEAIIRNEKTGAYNSVKLTPHLNMSDNLHYAQNIKLPGNTDEKYTVRFIIKSPIPGTIGMHYDWRNEVSDVISSGGNFTFTNLNFEEVANSSRR
ncbi:MAG: hypothetical protein HOH08_03860 [Gammaproteobacteria bacterium]|jgi:hypothetical protein|nr:hypothetical protein [Gammaproteobacteria bacterium]MBT5216768.1 hypothetical protein [Gammaproteobacteria bacterium]MBT5542273.1 hypothetical protein [Gammaproteobacteria bacterium]MBT6074069.1 hypothetical protein [Gammaproteobacteria bacterium]